MQAVRLALPTLLLAYFLIEARKSRIFLLGIPFLMYMKHSVFFDLMRPFWMPGRFGSSFHLIFWLAIVWVICTDLLLPTSVTGRRRVRLFGPRLLVPEEAILLLVAAAVVINVCLSTLRFGDFASTVNSASGFVYMLLGYLMVRGILGQASLQDTRRFITALVVVNTLAAGLFILHQGLHLPIYRATEYQVTLFQGELITRSFYFMPQLLVLAVAFFVAKRTWDARTLVIAGITLAAIVISYTRSLILVALLEIALAMAVRLLKGGQLSMLMHRALAVVFTVACVGALVLAFLPTQSEFLLTRFRATPSVSNLPSDRNLQNRENKLRRTYNHAVRVNPVLGGGFASSGDDPFQAQVDMMTSDIAWVPLLYRLGLLGVGLIGTLFFVSAGRSLRWALSVDPQVEFFGLLWLCCLSALFLWSFSSETFMSPGRYALNLWFFAFIAGQSAVERSRVAESAVEQRPRVVLSS